MPLGKLVKDSDPTSYLSLWQKIGTDSTCLAFFTIHRVFRKLYNYSKFL